MYADASRSGGRGGGPGPDAPANDHAMGAAQLVAPEDNAGAGLDQHSAGQGNRDARSLSVRGKGAR